MQVHNNQSAQQIRKFDYNRVNSNQFKSEELKENKVESCRICLAPESMQLNLISPCLCTGSIKYCHQKCLLIWLNTKQEKNKSTNLIFCQICKFPFQYQLQIKKKLLNKQDIIKNTKKHWCVVTFYSSLILISIITSIIIGILTFNGKIKLAQFDPGFIIFILVLVLSIGIIVTMVLLIAQKCALKQTKVVTRIKSQDVDLLRRQSTQYFSKGASTNQ